MIFYKCLLNSRGWLQKIIHYKGFKVVILPTESRAHMRKGYGHWTSRETLADNFRSTSFYTFKLLTLIVFLNVVTVHLPHLIISQMYSQAICQLGVGLSYFNFVCKHFRFPLINAYPLIINRSLPRFNLTSTWLCTFQIV